VLQVTVPGALRPSAQATAFAIADGRALTVAHVLDGARGVLVGVPGAHPRAARVLRTDRRLDLALLAVPGLRAPAAHAGAARAGEGATVRVLRDGRSRILRATVRRPITARMHETGGVHVRPALELGAAIVRGDSGAPVVDRDGRVIGMVFAVAARREGTAYALAAGARGLTLGP
jgi:S1-C subfamily serine protease